MKDLICIGDIKLDTFIAIPEASVLCHFKKPTCELCIAHGKKIPVNEVNNQIAGSAPNVAVGVRRLGGHTSVLSTMGRDNVYRDAKVFLREQGVSTRHLFSVRGRQSSFSAVLNYQGESTQLAAHAHTPFVLPTYFPRAKWMHLSELGSSYEQLFEKLLAAKKAHPFQLSFNPGAVQIKENTTIFNRVVQETDLLFVNRLEAGIMCELQGAEIADLLKCLSKKTKGMVIVTDGKQGAYATDRKMTYHAPMFPGERVEATGAGDSFSSGVLGALLAGLPLQKALAWGSVNAASCVQFIGPTKGLLTRAEIAELLRKHPEYRVIPN